MPLRRAIPILLVLVAVAWPRVVRAQLSEIRGTVADSASGAPIGAAVVTLLDAGGGMLLRTLTSDRGTYRVLRPAEAAQLRVVRLGFEPRTVPLSRATARAAGGYDLDVRLAPLARTLQQVEVSAARGCDARGNRGNAVALLDAARAGLLASIVAREKDPPKLHVLRFERQLDGDGVEIVSQTVRVDSSASATTSFNAVQSATDFITGGFRTGADGEYTFFGPDAAVLLDERFEAGYCFTVAPGDSARRTQVGLHFAPASRRSGRVDIDGTLWIDTLARELTEITFRYVGLEPMAEGLGAGGRIGFRTLANGAPFIDRWQLRLVGAPPRAPGDTRPGPTFLVREIGGELAEARWADGRRWAAPLATAHLTAVGVGNRPAPGAVLRLEGTEYRVTTDAEGHGTIPNLLPGPYRVVVDDPVVRPLGLTLPTRRTLTAVRGSALVVRVPVDGPIVLAQSACRRTDAPKNDEAWLVGRAVDATGREVPDARWQVFEANDGKWRARTDVGTAGTNGVFALCRGLDRGRTIELVAWRADAADTVRVRQVLDGALAILPVRFPLAARRLATGPRTTVAGQVRDSTSGAPVADARVRFVGTPFEGLTDETGHFVVGGVPLGRYTLEIGTPLLDRLGIVGSERIEVRDSMPPLLLSPPPLRESIGATCRSLGGTGTSLVVGRLSAASGDLAAIAGYRVVAAWDIDTTTLQPTDAYGQPRTGGWVRATPDPGTGTFRLCDVPVGRTVVLRAEADTMSAGAAAPQTILLSATEPIARQDLRLDPARVAAPTFSGTVLADSAGVAIEGAEVTIKDLGRSVLTDKRGRFRFGDVPTGPHLVSIRAVGYAPLSMPVQLENDRALEQRVLLPRAAQALAAVAVVGNGAPPEFEERRALKLGSYLTRAELEAAKGQRLGTVMAMVPGFGTALSTNSGGAHAWIVGRRAPTHLLPRGGGTATCGTGRTNPCTFTFADYENQGFYCPTEAERRQGLSGCACFAQVYLDDRLMNNSRPTEPFDVNSIPIEQIAGVEFYPSPASTPARYSQLNAVCGVMLIWTRRS